MVRTWKAVTAVAAAYVAGGVTMLFANGNFVVMYLFLKTFCE